MRVDLITRIEDVHALRREWDQLALLDRRDGFFRTPSWYLAWMKHIRPDAQPFVVVVRDDAGRLLGLAPLCAGRFKEWGFNLRAVGFGGREVVSGDYLGFPTVPDGRRQILDAILQFLWSTRSAWSLLVLGEVLVGSELHAAVESWGLQNKLPVRLQEERICPYIALPDSFEQFLASVSYNARYEIRSDTRKLFNKLGGTIESYFNAEVSDKLDILVDLHLARWKLKNLPGTLDQPCFLAFLREFCGDLPAGATARLRVLRYQGRPVAGYLTFKYGDSVFSYQTGWDAGSPAARYSLGTVLTAQAVKDAIEKGFRYYDLLRGDESYKWRLTKSYRKTVTFLFGQTLAARGYLGAAGAKDVVKRVLQRNRPVAVPA